MRVVVWILVALSLWVGRPGLAPVQAGPLQICERIGQTAPQGSGAALVAAVSSGDEQLTQQLLEAGGNPNTRDFTGRGLLSIAATRPDSGSLLESLWQAGASPFLRDHGGRPIAALMHNSNQSWLQQRLAKLKRPESEDLALWNQWVLERRRHRLCQQYYDYRRYMPVDESTSSLLHSALGGSNPVDAAIVKLLAESGLSLTSLDPFGRTPITIAAGLEDPTALNILLSAGADPDIPDRFGRTALSHAITRERNQNAERLLEAGANPSLSGSGAPPLLSAIERNNARMVDLLLSKGVSPNQTDAHGASALAMAVDKGNHAIVEQLLQHRANPNGRDAARRPALIIAAQGLRSDLATLLLKHSANTTATGPDGRTVLDILGEEQPPQTEYDILGAPIDALPDESPVELELVETRQPPPDPIYPSDLDADADGGYLPAIDAQIDQLVSTAHRHSLKLIDARFHSRSATPDLDQQLAELEQQLGRNHTAYRNKKSAVVALKAKRATLAQAIISNRAAVIKLQQHRVNEAEQIAEVAKQLRQQIEELRRLRAKLRIIEQGIQQLGRDYSRFFGDLFADREELLDQVDVIAEERASELELLRSERRQLDQLYQQERQAIRAPLEVEQDYEARLKSERQAHQTMIELASQALREAASALRTHLGQCKTNEAVANGCHNPGNCKTLNERNRWRSQLKLHQQRKGDTEQAIRQHQSSLNQRRRQVNNELGRREKQHRRQTDAIKRRQAKTAESYNKPLILLWLRIKEIELGYLSRRELLLDEYKDVAATLKADYGDDHQRLHQALARLIMGLKREPRRDSQAINGWAEINQIGKAYRDHQLPLPSGLEAIERRVGGLNQLWLPFIQGFGLEIDHIQQSQRLEAKREALEQRSRQLQQQLEILERQRLDLRLALADLRQQRQDAQTDNTPRQEMEQLLTERSRLYTALLREAFRPAAARSLSGMEIRQRDQQLKAEIKALTGKELANPLLEQLEQLPSPAFSGAVKLIDFPGHYPKKFTPLTPQQSRHLTAYWLSLIDFDAGAWQAANHNQAKGLLDSVFYSAITSQAKFDRAEFTASQGPAYRFITMAGSYWLQADGSLLSFLQRDLDPLFEYRFRTPAESTRGKQLRTAYRHFIKSVANAFPELPDSNKDLLVAVEAAFRTLDDRRFHHLSFQVLNQLQTLADLAISASPTVGQYYSLVKIIRALNGFDHKTDLKDILEVIYEVVMLRPYGRFFAKPYRPSLADYSSELTQEVREELTQHLLFHYDQLTIRLKRRGDDLGLGSLDKTRQQVQQLHNTLANTQWLSEESLSTGPTPNSQWSNSVKPNKIDSQSISLTQIISQPQPIYIDGILSQERKKSLENCLGQPLLDRPVTTLVKGLLTFGVAHNKQDQGYCIIFVKK